MPGYEKVIMEKVMAFTHGSCKHSLFWEIINQDAPSMRIDRQHAFCERKSLE